ncbi:MAG: ATP-dependent zinc metalloprotease FtsH [Candidatus Izimaplasma sp.]|nr:ATP-dependent zinc metalloprotease FtsH [Candidatus Izimaplasma bacterium]
MAEKKQLKPKQGKPQQGRLGSLIVVAIILLFVFAAVYMYTYEEDQPIPYKYSTFVTKINSGDVETIKSTPISGEINTGAYLIEGTLKNGSSYYLEVPTQETLENIIDLAETNGIVYEHIRGSSYSFWSIIIMLLPIIILIFIIGYFMRNQGGNNKAFEFGKNRAKLNKGKTTTFDHVAGIEEEKAEMAELIDFLKNPKKYIALGARIPTGVLLVGPPGTGKTLLARAVAGEASVPFYSISGSDFVEMFVGVGASRVRDMFKTAKQNAPCIVFIDEIDAVGRQRGAGLGGGHDEREQTLNQLLVEMDGFGSNSGIIVIAATNRPDVLDPALLRPGRFDRQITIARPDIKSRKAILMVHAKNKKIDPSVTFDEIAKRTPGFTGADLENLLNEAAILTARENKHAIKIHHLDEAIDRVMMGPAKKSRALSKRERDFIAHHEAGHAVLGIKLDNANIVHKVTIIPRGKTGGYALMLPEEEESFLSTKSGLLDRITGLLGGRVSEEIIFDDVSTGAHNDFQQATEIARSMVTEYGMSSLGPIQYEKRSDQVFLGRDYNTNKMFSDQVALEIDNEVRHIIDECYTIAEKVLKENLDLVKLIAKFLLEVETLTKENIYEIVDTGTLSWWDNKKVKDAAKKVAKPKITNEVKNTVENEEVKTEDTTKKNES